jgi:hypothetical protein
MDNGAPLVAAVTDPPGTPGDCLTGPGPMAAP